MAYGLAMRSPLVRFGVAIDAPLLKDLDALAAERGSTRSELFRDLARAEVARAQVGTGVDAVGALTIVYDHHVRDLSEKLTDLQHEMGDGVRAALHVHLSHDHCLEVIVIRGRSDVMQAVAKKILGMRGVKHGGIEIVAGLDMGRTERDTAGEHKTGAPRKVRTDPVRNDHAHDVPHSLLHQHGHGHSHPHSHAIEPPVTRRKSTKTRGKTGTKTATRANAKTSTKTTATRKT